ncbi:threonylcarbamoyl-AMP synthase [Tumebacillus algifaecis]|uniref:Threonylcarbamoyl-AMP synthase n=1 Tax=Tumebacillus algifaecis TaxID=1214604 RepID=A0A223CX93_9BACL|nr:L-threonylcarbamoyladenylate synthase [Tumebacillus algifaecis]ASS73835.1 threonylcarbamoyl-AMP synthase [Tumebacillus algifaecis]
METKRLGTTEQDIAVAAELLRQGEVVGFPTETVYGLGANAWDAAAVDKIFAAKGRPADNPLIVHIAHKSDVEKLARTVPLGAKLCMDRFWPGPLTLVLPCVDSVPRNVTAGLDTVGIRMPDHVTALQLIDAAGAPLAAPSANRSGRPSPTLADHVLEDLNGRIAGIVDGGAAGVGVESTVLDFSGEVPMILRPGGVTREMLVELLGEVLVDPVLQSGVGTPKSPGVKYTHYAPKGEMWLVEGPRDQAEIAERVAKARQAGYRVGVLTTAERAELFTADVVIACGRRDDLSTVASGLYDAIRQFDHAGADLIYSEVFPETGVGLAVMNRLRKAASHRVIYA